MQRILVTGAMGQIGSELVPALRERFGADRVVASDLRIMPRERPSRGIYEHLDCTQAQQILELVRRHEVGTIYHLAALLSAVAEDKPHVAWSINMGGLYNVLEVARQYECQVFFPSSIGAFGPSTPRESTPQVTIQRPTTMYGVTKVAGELLCDYYAGRFGVDARGLRLPGLISYAAPPGGGTTDYAVEIFHHALRYGRYTCFLAPDTRLDMMYMPDAIRSMIELMAGRGRTAQPPQRLQCERDEHHAGGARRRDRQARGRASRSTTRSIRCARRSPTSWPRARRCARRARGLGLCAEVRPRGHDADMLAQLRAQVGCAEAG